MSIRDEQELSAAVAQASGPLVIRGGGTRDVGMGATGALLDVSGLRGVRLYEPGAMTLVVGAGEPVADIETLLAEQGQRLAFEPMDHRVLLGTQGAPTIGGCIAANASGPRRVLVGACRDHLLGVRFVDGQGRVIRNGGRVMKNVTGYDLVKLMAGSWGTLGVLSEVSLKVLPVPETARSLEVPVQDNAQALEVMTKALGTPYEVSGAASYNGRVWLRVEGFAAQVDYRFNALRDLLGGEAADIAWDDIRDVAQLADLPLVWRVNLRASRMAQMLASITELGDSEVLLDWGGAMAWIGFGAASPEQSGETQPAGADAIRAHMHQMAAQLGGHATLVKAPAALRSGGVFQPQPAAIEGLSAGLRAQFDPRGILNPGRMS